jgi:hypothetical protein
MAFGEAFANDFHDRIISISFDGAYVRSVGGDRQHDAGPHRLSIDEQCAGTAHAVFAPEMGAGEEALIADEVGKRGARLDRSGPASSVYGDFDGHYALQI